MAVIRSGRIYALTSLQIGDIQSHVSRLFLLVAFDGLKLVFLVDNGPWTVNSRPSRPAELWQMLVYKSRGSPFVNRLRDYASGLNGGNNSQQGFLQRDSLDRRGETGQEKEDGWLALFVALQRSCKQRTEVKNPSHGLYGCVAFEVAWSDVRGINYTNELQTDTCVSLEVRIITKREFDSLEQAKACYDTILSGSKDMRRGKNDTKSYGFKNAGVFVRSKGQGVHLKRLLSEKTRVTKMHSDDSVSGSGTSEPSEKKTIRRRKIEESSRSNAKAPSPSLISEHGRGFICSITSKLGPRLAPINVKSLTEYFTPPSSPYEGEVFNLFKRFSFYQHKDLKQSCIVRVDKESGARTEAGVGARINEKTEFVDVCDSNLGDSKLVCSQCKEIFDARLCERAQDCRSCTSNVGLHPDAIYVRPDRLIAPAETYRDTLILFRFSEPLLPLELQQIITENQRLLKMLESGLPPWVIFSQSYPILCHCYRPWMRPLCGTIYYLISIMTVLIGFYDLYKNVPVLKKAAAHFCGPLFKWIEEWGMVSRLRYLGTMLFLQNCERAFEWVVAVTKASRQVSMVVMRPILQPLIELGEMFLPLWMGLSDKIKALLDLAFAIFSYIFLSMSFSLSVFLRPFITILSATWNLGMSVFYPVFSSIWTLSRFPVQLLRLAGSSIGILCDKYMDGLRNVWFAIQSTLQLFLASRSPALQSFQVSKSSAPNTSIWRTLWNDILSKVFHAVNGIMKGLAAFIAACNRHRLSIYKQAVEFLFRIGDLFKSSHCISLTACQQLFLVRDSSEVAISTVDDEVIHPYFQAQSDSLNFRDDTQMKGLESSNGKLFNRIAVKLAEN